MIKAVVFDMAGTTVNDGSTVYQTITDALNREGFNIDLSTVLLNGGGKEKRQAFRDILTIEAIEWDEEVITRCYVDFKSNLEKAYRQSPVAQMPGAGSLFQRLRENNIRIVLNTGYPESIARLLLSQLNWIEGETFDLLVTGDRVEKGRPHPDMIHSAMKRLALSNPQLIAKIGDTTADIEEGLNARCGLVVGITTGAHSSERLLSAGAHALIDCLADLAPLLLERH